MSGYLSNLLTHTTTRYNSLRRNLLSSEDDGDTEDDTHICRVLRTYYTEKGRPYPQWLPPDPNDKRAVTPQPYAQQGGYMSGGGKSPYSNLQTSASNRSSLNELWDPPSAAAGNAPMQPQSLRNARRPPGQHTATTPANLLPPQPRPLPSQRPGTYQSVPAQQAASRPSSRYTAEPSPPGSSNGPAGGSAQERLKARLWGAKGGGAVSPSPSSVGDPNPYDQPRMNPNAPYSRGGNPYDSGTGQRYG